MSILVEPGIPRVIVEFRDRSIEIFPHADADVFDRGVPAALTVTSGDTAYTLSGWSRATAYDADGYRRYAFVAPTPTPLLLIHRDFIAAARAGSDQSWEAFQLDYVSRVLATFYRAELSMSSVQPVLDLAVALNPELTEVRR